MPISLRAGQTVDEARQAPKTFTIDDAVQEGLWKLIGRLRRDLSQLRRLGPVDSGSEALFSPDEVRGLMRDIKYLVEEESEVARVLTCSLKAGLKRVQAFLETASATNATVYAHIE